MEILTHNITTKTKSLFWLIALACLSCNNNPQAEETAYGFCEALVNNDPHKMQNYYPDSRKLCYIIDIDKFRIRSSVALDNGKKKVRVLCETISNSKIRKSSFDLLLRPRQKENPSAGYVIYDSKGLCNTKNDSTYVYAYWNGDINDNSTDQEVALAMNLWLLYLNTKRMSHN